MNEPMKLAVGLFTLAGVVGCGVRQAIRSSQTAVVAPLAAAEPSGSLEDDLSRYRTLLSDPDAGIRIAAARVLVGQGDRTAQALLLGALRSPDVHHRIDAALALQDISDQATTQALRQAADQEQHPLARAVLNQVLKRESR